MTRKIVGSLHKITLLTSLLFTVAACHNKTESNDASATKNVKDDAAALAAAGYFPNDSGALESYSTFGAIDKNNPFFQALPGSNGRSCNSCHVQGEGWTVTPKGLQARFDASQGTDPIFKTNDGSVSPLAPVETLEQKRAAYSMLLNKGLIRVGLPMPANAEFTLEKVEDPYGYASEKQLSMFRRVLPSANLKLNVSFMSDLRATLKDPKSKICTPGTTDCYASVEDNLKFQANDATTGHAQVAAGLSAAEQAAIVAFESTLFSAQVYDNKAKFLNVDGAKGGAVEVSKAEFHYGINSPPTDFLTGAEFDGDIFKNYSAWAKNPDKKVASEASSASAQDAEVILARESIARGQEMFNRRVFNITNTRGINDDFDSPNFETTCSGCHNGPNAGTRTDGIPVDIGTSDASERTPDLPLYTFKHKVTGEVRTTTDPGRALITGKWSDMNRLKVTNLRGLAGRAPYFHNGSAATIKDTVVFYNKRFEMKMTDADIADMTAFLSSL